MQGDGFLFRSLEEPSVAFTPEATLAIAVLHRAVLDCVSPNIPNSIKRSAYLYLTGMDRHWPFSFLNVAEFLSDDPEGFRQNVLKYLRRSLGTEDLESWVYESTRVRGKRLSVSELRMRYCRRVQYGYGN